MKKTLTIVMALALAVSMLASFAFVLYDGTTPGVKGEGFKIASFHVTDDAALVGGVRVYAPLANLSETTLYAKNTIIRFAVNFEVLNPYVAANNAKAFTGKVTMEFSSSTVDLALSSYAGQIALHVPYTASGLTTFNLANVQVSGAKIPGTDPADPDEFYGKGGDYKVAYNTLEAVFEAKTNSDAEGSKLTATGADIGTKFSNLTKASHKFSYVFSGVTLGDVSAKGLVTLKTGFEGKNKFTAEIKDGSSPELTVGGAMLIKKGTRTYVIHRIDDFADSGYENLVKHQAISNATGYNFYKAGYRIYLATYDSTDNSGVATYNLTPVAQLDTEVVKFAGTGVGLDGKDVPGVGVSLGLEKLVGTGLTATVASNGDVAVTGTETNVLVMRNFLTDGSYYYMYGENAGSYTAGAKAFSPEELARLNTMFEDFGFGTGANYSYKITDSYFETAGDYKVVLNAEYNGGKVVPIEIEEEGDLEEGTEEEELPEEEGDIEEEIDDEEEVPAETGDFASDIALALTAAAIVAAAALAFVMKKARD